MGGGHVSFLDGRNFREMCAAGANGDSIGIFILYPAS